MKIHAKFDDSHAALLDSGEGKIWWGGVGNATPQDPAQWRAFIAECPGGESRCVVEWEWDEVSPLPEGAMWRGEFGDNPVASIYGKDGDYSPDWEWGDGDRFGHRTDFYRGIPVESGPTNWGGNESAVYYKAAGESIESLDRSGNVWRAADVMRLRQALRR